MSATTDTAADGGASTTDPPAAADEEKNFRVAIRVRPLNGRERTAGAKSAWKVKGDVILCRDNRELAMSFDNLFSENSETEEIYSRMAKGVVHSSMEGIHGTVFAYGQTSSGKTHTMMGSNQSPGVIPLAVADIFKYVRKTHDREFLIRVSYLEIYQECIRDLFKPEDTDLKIHEHPDHGFYVKSTEVVVSSEEQILQLMDSGEAHRHVGQTNMNEKSSRSHTIFRIIIESKLEICDDEPHSDDEDEQRAGICVRAASLNLVDLAGSERVGDTGAEGVRLKEAGNINKSLLTLGNVIKLLSDGKSAHIPYRDSKLTKILQPSLGGNGKTSMICAVTPASSHVDETRSTLLFASRAKNVKNNAVVNIMMDDKALLAQSKKEIAALQKQLSMLQAGSGVSTEEVAVLLRQKRKVEQDNEDLAQKVAQEASEKQQLHSKLNHMSALLDGSFDTKVVSRRVSNPVPSRRVTFGNYSLRAQGDRRISVLRPPGPLPLASANIEGGTFSKLQTFQDYKPAAAWEEDEDRDLGVLEEFEEMEEETDDDEDSSRNSAQIRGQQIEELQMQVAVSEQKVAELEATIASNGAGMQDCVQLQSEIAELRAEADGKQREIEHIEEEFSRVVAESKASEKQIAALKQEADDAKQKAASMDALQATLTEYKLELTAARTVAAAKSLSASDQLQSDKIRQDHLANIDQLERDRYSLKMALKEKTAELKTTNERMSAVEDLHKAVQRELEEARTVSENAARSALAQQQQHEDVRTQITAKCKSLEEQVANLRAETDSMAACQQAAVEAKARSQQSVEQSHAQIAQLQEHVTELREKNAAAQRELKEQAARLKQVSARNTSDGRAAGRDASKISTMHGKIKSLLQDKTILAKEKAAALREGRELQQRVEKLEAKVAKKDATSGAKALRAEVDDLRSKLVHSQTIQDGLRKQLEQAELQCAEMLGTLEIEHEELVLCRAGRDAAETRAATAAADLDRSQAEEKMVQEDLAKEQSQVCELQARIEEMSEALQELQSTVATKIEELHALQSERTQLQCCCEKMTTELEERRTDCDMLEAEIAHKDQLLSDSAKQKLARSQADAELSAAKSDVHAANKIIEELRRELTQLEVSTKDTIQANCEQAAARETEMLSAVELGKAAQIAREKELQSWVDEATSSCEAEKQSHAATRQLLAQVETALKSEQALLRNALDSKSKAEAALHTQMGQVAQCEKESSSAERDELNVEAVELELVAQDAVVALENKQAELDQLSARYKTLLASNRAQLANENTQTQLSRQVQDLTENVEMLEDDKLRLADLLAVKEKMVTDERAQREALEGKLKRITDKVKHSRSALGTLNQGSQRAHQ